MRGYEPDVDVVEVVGMTGNRYHIKGQQDRNGIKVVTCAPRGGYARWLGCEIVRQLCSRGVVVGRKGPTYTDKMLELDVLSALHAGVPYIA